MSWIAKLRAREVVAVALRVIGIVLGLELLYLAIANGLLASSLIRQGVSSADGMRLEYTSARSWLPGRVHIRGLRLRVEDYNVQFEVGVGRGTLDVSLTELLFKKFHVLSLLADDVTFRMRHKVHALGKNGPRLAAYPPIVGFSDPPLYRGPPPPPIPDSQYDLWSARIDDVVAHVRELWILEYRFRGDAEARGSFMVRPARWVRVEPAQLRFDAGSLSVGEHVVAQKLRGTLSCSVPSLDVRAVEGRAVLQQISSTVDLSLSGGDLSFLDVYSEPRANLRLGGGASWTLRARVHRGTVADGTKLELLAPRATLAHGDWSLNGGAVVRLARPEPVAPLALDVRLRGLRLRGTSACGAPPELSELTADVALQGAKLYQPLKLGPLQVDAKAKAPDLSCVEALLPRSGGQLAGAAELRLQLERDQHAEGTGRADLQVSGARFDHDDVHLHGDAQAQARFRLGQGEQRQPYAQGAVSLKLTSAGSLLSLAVAPLFRKLATGTLGLDVLDATVAFHVEPDWLELELTHAESGGLSGRGYWRRRSGDARGAFLLSAAGVNVGVKQQGSRVDVSPLVASHWLDDAWAELREPAAMREASSDSGTQSNAP